MIPEPNFTVKPDELVGRRPQVEVFRQALRQGMATRRTPSFAVVCEWGIEKSSLLSKCSAVCQEPEFDMLPVRFSVSNELGDYRRSAELLLDTLGGCLARSQSIQARVLGEAQNLKLKRLNVGPVELQREIPKLFLTSGTAILRHAFQDTWRRFIQLAQLNGIGFFLDHLHSLATPSQNAVALALRDQFHSSATEKTNCRICFAASASYFCNIKSPAELAVRFCDNVYLGPFSLTETTEYIEAIFDKATDRAEFAQWLHSKTGGHPYFMAFICPQCAQLAYADDKLDATKHWQEIFQRLEKEKLSADLPQVTDRELQLLRTLARCEEQEINRNKFAEYARIYFTSLTDKGRLIRTGRGHYRLYHPLFRKFLRQIQ